MEFSIQLPELIFRYPSALNPYTEITQQTVHHWMSVHHYFATEKTAKRFAAGKFAWVTGRAHPTADQQAMFMVAAWMSWLFMVDDLCDEESLGKNPARLRELHQQFDYHMKNPHIIPPQNNNVLIGLHNIWNTITDNSTPEWRARFIETFNDYAQGCQWEAENRAQQRIPSLDEYLEMRRKTSALYIFFDLIEIADRVKMPPQVLEHRDIKTLKTMANDGVAWFNDIVSLEKEIRSNDIHNLVLILKHTHKIPLQEAVNLAGEMFNDRMKEYNQYEAQRTHFAPSIEQDLTRYLTGLRCWVRGNIDWSFETGRYGQQAHALSS